MIKKIAGSLAAWLLMLAVLAALVFWCDSIIALLCAVFWCLLPFVTFLLNLLARKQVTAAVSVPITAAKREACTGYVTLHNSSLIPVAKVYCRVIIENRLTLEKTEKILTLSAAPGGGTTRAFTFGAGCCGYLQVRTAGVYLMDWLGFLPLPCRASAEAGMGVLPDTFSPQVFLRMSMVMREDADAWSQIRKGSDQTEIFALRDYVAGDSLKQIHWKLSSKRGTLIVREGSLPIEKSLLIFWDKNTRQATPEEMDAMAECAASVSQEIMNQGYSFTLGWTEGRQLLFENIDTDEQLLQTIPRMLKCGPDLEGGSGAYLNAQLGDPKPYGKVIYLAGTVPEDFLAFPCTDMTMLLCNTPAEQADWPAVSFRAENYQEDLALLEV